jgi:hypothetical protein
MWSELASWGSRRWTIAGGVAVIAFAAVALAAGVIAPGTAGSSTGFPWWSVVAIVAGASLSGLVIATYFGAPIGAEATVCDTRWPGFALLALLFATDARSEVPLLTGFTRPVVALAAILLLVWALRERITSERRATARLTSDHVDDVDGQVCATCRPLFTTRASTSSPGVPAHSDDLLHQLHDHHQKEIP